MAAMRTDFCRVFHPSPANTGDSDPCRRFDRPADWRLTDETSPLQQVTTALPDDPDRAILLQLTSEPLDLPALYRAAVHGTCGAVSSFIGTTRNSFNGRSVSRLEYTGYREMVARSMLRIAVAEFATDATRHVNTHSVADAAAASERKSEGSEPTTTTTLAAATNTNALLGIPGNGGTGASSSSRSNGGTLMRIVIAHRLGSVPVGEASVVIHVSSAHRRAAIEAAANLIETLKAQVPIWKKEFFTDAVVGADDADSGWCAPNDLPRSGADGGRRRDRNETDRDVPMAVEAFAWKSNAEFAHGFR